MVLKICGLVEEKNILDVLEVGKPDYIGFIFFEGSKRNNKNQILADTLKNYDVKRTGVFVNAGFDFIKKKVEQFNLKVVQLHGDETSYFCATVQSLGVEVIKVFSVGEQFDFSVLDSYVYHVDYFLFDTKGKLRGGNGEVFNWSLLKDYKLDKPYFLSGGIGNMEVEKVASLKDERLYAIDVNSKYELEPGVKDVNEIKTLRTLLDA